MEENKNEVKEQEVIEKKEQKNDEEEKINKLIKSAKDELSNMNYKMAEEQYESILNSEDKNILEIIEKNKVEILYNYSLCLYHQMKYQEATEKLFNIIINYDNKSKDSYYLLVKILYDINEYKRAQMLINKFKDINHEGDLKEFDEMNKEIEKCIIRRDNNIKRQFFYNAQKDIFKFMKNLNIFSWIFCSLFVLVLGNYLSKFI